MNAEINQTRNPVVSGYQSKVLLLLSGGIDSVTLAYELSHQGILRHCVAFDYGQTHAKEIQFAKQQSFILGIPFTRIELFQIKHIFKKCSIVDGGDSPVVPNRNAILLNIAAAMAAGLGCNLVAYGCNRDDKLVFADCRHEFVKAINTCLKSAEVPVEVIAPYIGWTKRQVIQRAKELNVDLDLTWTCYRGGQKPCGECPACKLIKESMA